MPSVPAISINLREVTVVVDEYQGAGRVTSSKKILVKGR
jgi:hypothetical protein